MSKRGLLLFIGSSIVGGLPWIFTKVLLEKFQPSGIVLIRALVAGFVMLLYSMQQRTFFAALKKWPWILVFALIQMTIPWWLTGYAQKSIDTTVVGLLMAATPIFALLFAFIEREHSAITRSRIAGVITGLVGVTCLIGIDAAIAVSLLCTAVGFIIYLEAIKEIGPQNIALLAFTNPIVSISVGVLFANELISLGLIIGFPIIMLGIYLSTSKKLNTQPLPM